jgi:hypothetical protein
MNINNLKLASVNINQGIFNIDNQNFYISGEQSSFICEGAAAFRKLTEIITENDNVISTEKLDFLSFEDKFFSL